MRFTIPLSKALAPADGTTSGSTEPSRSEGMNPGARSMPALSSHKLRTLAHSGLGEAGAMQAAVERMTRTEGEPHEDTRLRPVPPRVFSPEDVTRGLRLEQSDEQRVQQLAREFSTAGVPQRLGPARTTMQTRSYMLSALRTGMRHVAPDTRDEIMRRAQALWTHENSSSAGRPPAIRFHTDTAEKSEASMFVIPLEQEIEKSGERAGHKYTSRKPDGKGGYIYEYATKHEHEGTQSDEKELAPCMKCGGSGKYKWHNTGQLDVCYACNGTGKTLQSKAKGSAGRSLTAEQQVARVRDNPDRRYATEQHLRRLIGNIRNPDPERSSRESAIEDLEENFPNPATNPIIAIWPGAVKALRELGVIKNDETKKSEDVVSWLEEMLEKAGAPKAEHKYISRRADGKGGWIYSYAEEGERIHTPTKKEEFEIHAGNAPDGTKLVGSEKGVHHGDFALHRTKGKLPRWNITHKPSGMSVDSSFHRGEAEAMLHHYGTHGNGADDIEHNKEQYKKLLGVKQAFHHAFDHKDASSHRRVALPQTDKEREAADKKKADEERKAEARESETQANELLSDMQRADEGRDPHMRHKLRTDTEFDRSALRDLRASTRSRYREHLKEHREKFGELPSGHKLPEQSERERQIESEKRGQQRFVGMMSAEKSEGGEPLFFVMLDGDGALVKGVARGGKYYRRVPTGKADRPYRYYYTREEYEKDHGAGAHLHGPEMEEQRLYGAGAEHYLREADKHHEKAARAQDEKTRDYHEERAGRFEALAEKASTPAPAEKKPAETKDVTPVIPLPEPAVHEPVRPAHAEEKPSMFNRPPPGGWSDKDKVPQPSEEERAADLARHEETKRTDDARRARHRKLVFEVGKNITVNGREYKVEKVAANLEKFGRMITVSSLKAPPKHSRNPFAGIKQLLIRPNGNAEIWGTGATKRDDVLTIAGPGVHEGETDVPIAERERVEPPPAPHTPTPPPESPRAEAAKATKAAEESGEYVNDRASKIEQRGEDVLGSARHKTAVWKSLREALDSTDAPKLFTRDFLSRQDPPDLISRVQSNGTTACALSGVVGYLALNKFPAQPGIPRLFPKDNVNASYYDGDRFITGYKYGTAQGVATDREPPTQAEHERRQREHYYEAWKAVKLATETFVENGTVSPRALADRLSELHAQFRAKYGTLDASTQAIATMHDSLRAQFKKTSAVGQAEDFAKRIRRAYGSLEAGAPHIKEHALALLEGKSMNAAFGIKAERGDKIDLEKLYNTDVMERSGPASEFHGVKQALDELDKGAGGKYAMRGVQWGKSVTDDEREHHLKSIVDSFADLTDVLGLPASMASFNGKLAMAVGARGRAGAAAHYEPSEVAINLTRANGAGALAHEWGHFFDNTIAKITGHMTKSPKAAGAYASAIYASTSVPTPVLHEMNQFMESPPMVAFRQRLHQDIRELAKTGMLHKSEDYWASAHEVFARCFERHIQRKLERAGRKNTYLAGFIGGAPGAELWPTDEEADAMSSHFDAIFKSFRESDLLHKALRMMGIPLIDERFRHIVDRLVIPTSV